MVAAVTSGLAAGAAAGLAAGIFHAAAFRRLTIGLLTRRSSLLAVACAGAGLRVLLALAGILALRRWGAGGAGAGALGYWIAMRAVAGRAVVGRS